MPDENPPRLSAAERHELPRRLSLSPVAKRRLKILAVLALLGTAGTLVGLRLSKDPEHAYFSIRGLSRVKPYRTVLLRSGEWYLPYEDAEAQLPWNQGGRHPETWPPAAEPSVIKMRLKGLKYLGILGKDEDGCWRVWWVPNELLKPRRIASFFGPVTINVTIAADDPGEPPNDTCLEHVRSGIARYWDDMPQVSKWFKLHLGRLKAAAAEGRMADVHREGKGLARELPLLYDATMWWFDEQRVPMKKIHDTLAPWRTEGQPATAAEAQKLVAEIEANWAEVERNMPEDEFKKKREKKKEEEKGKEKEAD